MTNKNQDATLLADTTVNINRDYMSEKWQVDIIFISTIKRKWYVDVALFASFFEVN